MKLTADYYYDTASVMTVLPHELKSNITAVIYLSCTQGSTKIISCLNHPSVYHFRGKTMLSKAIIPVVECVCFNLKVNHVDFDFWRGKGAVRQPRTGPLKCEIRS